MKTNKSEKESYIFGVIYQIQIGKTSLKVGRERKNTPPFGYLAGWVAVRRQFRKPDIFPTTTTSCRSGQKVGLTHSSSAQSLQLPLHTD